MLPKKIKEIWICIRCLKITAATPLEVVISGNLKMGIDQTYINRIIESYFQIPVRPDKKGSGIGLAICKEFIEQ